jgi:hypothetical protein
MPFKSHQLTNNALNLGQLEILNFNFKKFELVCDRIE